VAFEEPEEDVSARIDPARLVLPLGGGNPGLEGADLEVLFDVDRKAVQNGQAKPPADAGIGR
jgi:hypothetical protein